LKFQVAALKKVSVLISACVDFLNSLEFWSRGWFFTESFDTCYWYRFAMDVWISR